MPKLDENQEKAVNCIKNCVVSAGAGSGKTTVLSFRFLNLVQKNLANCDEILTLTFTKKAASEMYERIYQKIVQAGLTQQIERFPDVTISTFDSFCSQILRQDCVRYGLSEDFSIADADDNESRIVNICHQVFDNNKGNKSIVFLSTLYNPTNLNALFSIYGSKYLNLAHESDVEYEQKIVKRLFEEVKKRAEQNFSQVSTDVLRELKFEGNIDQINKSLELMEAPDEDAFIDYLNKIKLDGRRDKGISEIKKVYMKTLKNIVGIYTAIKVKDVYLGIYPIFKQIEAKYFSYKRTTGALTYSDVAALALDILKTNTKLRAYYKKKFKFIMVDEFQDNNSKQKQLLYFLAEKEGQESTEQITAKELNPNKLFFVGDEKQSIYRFRGADVSVFKALKGEITSVGGENLSLRTNYRTEPALIKDFNFLFSRVMKNDGEPYEADFEELGTRAENPAIKPTFTIAVKLNPEEKAEDDADKNDSEAYYVADLIYKMTTTDDYLVPSDNEGGKRRPKYSDIAILLRTLGKQSIIEKALQIRNIPYCLQETRALLSDAVANDFYNVLQLLVFPNDKLSYLAVLSSPLCNLDSQSIHKVLDLEVFDEEVVLSLLDKENLNRFQIAANNFKKLKNMVGKVKITSLLSYIWKEWGYRYFLVTKSTSQIFLSQYDFFFNLAKNFDDKNEGLPNFLTYLRPMLGSVNKMKDTEIIREDNEGVQIMTIHKSKGLEFPIVIVANTGSGSRNSSPIVESYEDEKGLIPLPNQTDITGQNNIIFSEKKGSEAKKEIAELKRLMYVSLTRVETHLVITGCMPARGKLDSIKDTNFLGMLATALNIDVDQKADDFKAILIKEGNYIKLEKAPKFNRTGDIKFDLIDSIDKTFAFLKKEEFPISLVDSCKSLYNKPEILKPNLSEGHVAVTKFIETETNGEDEEFLPSLPCDEILDKYNEEADFGTFVHKLLELTVRTGQQQDIAALLDSSNAFVKLKGKEKKMVIDSASTLVDNFFNSSVYEKIKDWKLKTEVNFFYCPEDIIIEGVIDLLCENEKKILILDYKTDKSWNENKHQKQVELYKEAVSRTTNKSINCTLFYLRAPDIFPLT